MRVSAGALQATNGSVGASIAFTGKRAAPSWRLLAVSVLLSVMLAAALVDGLAGERSAMPAARPSGLSHEGFFGVPVALQGALSATEGGGDSSYLIGAARGELGAANPAQHLQLSFGRSGVSLRSGATHLGLRLRAIGYGSSLRALGEAQPRVTANRVAYRRADLSEWYVNGPLGLEQGFTIPAAPGRRPAGVLTLSIALSGNTHARLGAGGRSVTFGPSDALRYDGLAASDADGRALHSWLALEGGGLSLRVDTRDARYPLRIDPLIQQGGKLAVAQQTGFGRSAALSADGQTALVTADNGAWIFTRSGSTWTQQGEKLTGSDEIGNAEFGTSVALSSDDSTVLIGGRADNGDIGAAWVFTRSGSTWTQQGEKLTAQGEIGKGEFGVTVALSANGDTALIGAPGDNEDQGAAWVFSRSGSTWSQQGEKLVGSGIVGVPFFAKSVALSADGNTALIGAPVDRDVGAAWVFTRSGSTWSQQGEKLTANGEVGKGWFAWSVALSADGDTALIGGFDDDVAVGAAWVFTRSGSTWSQQGGKLTGAGEHGKGWFGQSVALSSDGNTALIGANGDSGYEGAAWVFTRSGSTWSPQGEKLTGSGERGDGLDGNTGGNFGYSVALSADGATALVGGLDDDDFAGAAWVFADQATNPPNAAEYGRCVGVPRPRGGVTGQYARASCNELGGHHRYQWYPGVARTHFSLSTTEGVATFESVNRTRVTCKGETGTGEYTGAGLTTVGGVVLAFTDCEGLGAKCSTAGDAEGEVVTNPLEGVIGIIQRGEGAGANKVGLELFPGARTGNVIEFACGVTPVSVRGAVIVPVPANKMRLSSELRYSARKGRQEPESFLGEPKAVLEASFDLGPFEQLGLRLKTTQADEEALELNAAL